MSRRGFEVRPRRAFVLALLAAGALLEPSAAAAEIEVFGLFGALIGGEIELEGDLSVEARLKNSPFLGARGGWYRGRLGIEGAIVGSPSGLTGRAFDVLEVDVRVLYAEANGVVFFGSGAFRPFLTGGVGLHSLSFDVNDVFRAGFDRLGFNAGGGFQRKVGSLTLRFDLRDHFVPLGPEDFGLALLRPVLGARAEQTLHNLEISLGVGF